MWGLYDQNIGISQIVEPGYTLCYAASWYGKRGVIFDSLHKSSRKKFVRGVHKLLEEADAVVHFNGERFDIPTLNKEFILEGLKPPAPFKQIDLLKTCRGQFKFASNKLDYVAQALGLGAKVHHKGQELWSACMDPKRSDHESAWRTMERYNKGDVRLTERLYNRLLPWIKNHPNHGLYDGSPDPVCRNCGGRNLISRGTARTTTLTYRRFQCGDCGTWNRSCAAIKEVTGALKSA